MNRRIVMAVLVLAVAAFPLAALPVPGELPAASSGPVIAPAPQPALAIDPAGDVFWLTVPPRCGFFLQRCIDHCGGEVDCLIGCDCSYAICAGDPLPSGC